jgi:chromosome segregation ATPase
MNDDLKIILKRLTAIESRQANIETGIINLGTRVEAIETKIDNLQPEFVTNWESLQTQLSDMHSDIRKLDRKFDLLNEDVMEVRSDQRDMNRRVDKLDRKVS